MTLFNVAPSYATPAMQRCFHLIRPKKTLNATEGTRQTC